MPASSPRVGGESFATKARLAGAPAAARAGRGSSAPKSPKRICRGSAVRRRSVGSPSPGSRVQVEQPARRRADRAAAAPAAGVIAPIDQLAVPAKQRRRAHRPTRPGASRQRPGERGEDRSIDGTEPRSPRLPAQDRQLVSEQEDLEFLRALRSAQQHDQLNQTAERQIDQRPDHDNLRNQGTPKLSMSVPTRPPTANRVSEPHGFRDPRACDRASLTGGAARHRTAL